MLEGGEEGGGAGAREEEPATSRLMEQKDGIFCLPTEVTLRHSEGEDGERATKRCMR